MKSTSSTGNKPVSLSGKPFMKVNVKGYKRQIEGPSSPRIATGKLLRHGSSSNITLIEICTKEDELVVTRARSHRDISLLRSCLEKRYPGVALAELPRGLNSAYEYFLLEIFLNSCLRHPFVRHDEILHELLKGKGSEDNNNFADRVEQLSKEIGVGKALWERSMLELETPILSKDKCILAMSEIRQVHKNVEKVLKRCREHMVKTELYASSHDRLGESFQNWSIAERELVAILRGGEEQDEEERDPDIARRTVSGILESAASVNSAHSALLQSVALRMNAIIDDLVVEIQFAKGLQRAVRYCMEVVNDFETYKKRAEAFETPSTNDPINNNNSNNQKFPSDIVTTSNTNPLSSQLLAWKRNISVKAIVESPMFAQGPVARFFPSREEQRKEIQSQLMEKKKHALVVYIGTITIEFSRYKKNRLTNILTLVSNFAELEVDFAVSLERTCVIMPKGDGALNISRAKRDSSFQRLVNLQIPIRGHNNNTSAAIGAGIVPRTGNSRPDEQAERGSNEADSGDDQDDNTGDNYDEDDEDEARNIDSTEDGESGKKQDSNKCIIVGWTWIPESVSGKWEHKFCVIERSPHPRFLSFHSETDFTQYRNATSDLNSAKVLGILFQDHGEILELREIVDIRASWLVVEASVLHNNGGNQHKILLRFDDKRDARRWIKLLSQIAGIPCIKVEQASESISNKFIASAGMDIPAYVRVVYDFDAIEANELTVKESDVAAVVSKHDRDWYFCEDLRKPGLVGLVPISYVVPATDEDAVTFLREVVEVKARSEHSLLDTSILNERFGGNLNSPRRFGEAAFASVAENTPRKSSVSSVVSAAAAASSARKKLARAPPPSPPSHEQKKIIVTSPPTNAGGKSEMRGGSPRKPSYVVSQVEQLNVASLHLQPKETIAIEKGGAGDRFNAIQKPQPPQDSN